jgi:hypothetical protein
MNSIYVDEENYLEKSRANIVYKNVYYKLTFLFLINEFEAFKKCIKFNIKMNLHYYAGDRGSNPGHPTYSP